MPWRWTLIRYLGAGVLGGVTAGDWWRLLRDNRFAVAPSCLLRAMVISGQSVQNSLLAWIDRQRYAAAIDQVEVPPPLFLLGHWRQGTTHLHNLLTVDDRFAFPTTYQTLFPHGFLTAENFAGRLIAPLFPHRRPMDNVAWSLDSPQEDEFALLTLSLVSPYLGCWAFPQRREHYDRHLTLQNASPAETAAWKAAFERFARKLTFKYGRPLVFKSPPHTARIALLLSMFPDARFVHIHRNPYAVFPSCQHMMQVNFAMHRLQAARRDDLDDYILRQYREMYDAFFAERDLIPAGRFYEIGYEQLEADPLGELRRLYAALDLPDFAHVEPDLTRYVATLSGYQKNKFRELPDDLRVRIAHEWRRSFDAWSYPT